MGEESGERRGEQGRVLLRIAPAADGDHPVDLRRNRPGAELRRNRKRHFAQAVGELPGVLLAQEAREMGDGRRAAEYDPIGGAGAGNELELLGRRQK